MSWRSEGDIIPRCQGVRRRIDHPLRARCPPGSKITSSTSYHSPSHFVDRRPASARGPCGDRCSGSAPPGTRSLWRQNCLMICSGGIAGSERSMRPKPAVERHGRKAVLILRRSRRNPSGKDRFRGHRPRRTRQRLPPQSIDSIAPMDLLIRFSRICRASRHPSAGSAPLDADSSLKGRLHVRSTVDSPARIFARMKRVRRLAMARQVRSSEEPVQ